jgi:hypothetical protein
LAAIAFLIIKNWDTLKAFFLNFWNPIKEIFIRNFKIIMSWVDTLKNAFVSAFDFIAEKIQSVFALLGKITSIPNKISGALSRLNPFVSDDSERSLNPVLRSSDEILNNKNETNVSITLEQARDGSLSVKNVKRPNRDRGKTIVSTGLMTEAGAF